MKIYLDFEQKPYPQTIGRAFLYYYNAFAPKTLPESLDAISGFEDFLKFAYKINNTPLTLENTSQLPTFDLPNSKKLVVSFSGGLDSTFQALKFRNLGYDVHLFHGINMNGAYPDETTGALEFASKFSFPIETLKYFRKANKEKLENPMHSVQLLANAIDYGVSIGATVYAGGNDLMDVYEDVTTAEATQQFGFSDLLESYQLFESGIKNYIPNYEYFGIGEGKFERTKFIYDNFMDALFTVKSCFSPYRFKNMLHNKNQSKFGIELLPHRCGSCWKCAFEYIMLLNLGYYKLNQDYLHHCCNLIRAYRKQIQLPGSSPKDSDEHIVNQVLTYY